ncbi:universal stress protein [Desulfovibrio sp. OttesenSCG-928-G11]|nr:universal stress protein [Desulfovibrio sp. OttesenSCG-928-G11]
MPTIKKILCAVDLSEMSAKIAACAIAMANAFSAELLVLYVAPSSVLYSAFEVQPKGMETFMDELARGAEKQMRKVMDELFSSLPAQGRVLTGYPADEVLGEAERFGADLIVMGTHGRKGVDLLLFGSVAEKVVKGADVPVLTVNPDCASP